MTQLVRIGLSRRARGLTRARAQAYWRTIHADLFRSVPRLVLYVQNHAVLTDDDRPLIEDCAFDIFAEVTFESEEVLATATQSAYYQTVVLPDEADLLTAEGRSFLVLRRASQITVPSHECVSLAVFLSEDWQPQNAHPAPSRFDRIEKGSGPIGLHARYYAQWCCGSEKEAQTLHATLLQQRSFVESRVAATIVRPLVVLGPDTSLPNAR